MAIVNMSKLSIIGLEAEKRQLLNLIMKRGFVQIDDSSFLTEEEEVGEMLERDGLEREVIEIEQKISIINQSLESIKSYVKVKKPMLAPKSDYEFFSVKQADDMFETALKINVLYKDLESVKSKENMLKLNREIFNPWISLDIPSESMETKCSKTVLGTFAASANMDQIRQRLDEEGAESLLGVVSSDKQLIYSYMISHLDTYEAAMAVVKDFGFVPLTLPESVGTPQQAVAAIDLQLASLAREEEKLVVAIQDYAEKIPSLENLYDYYTIKRDERKTYEKLVKTKSTFLLNGWIPTQKADALVKELSENFTCHIETEKGDAEVGFPILLENNRLITPFESITNMYSCPSSKDIDPNIIMAFFYIIFFGMMLSDAGYGIVIAIAAFIIVKKGKMRKGEGNLFKLLGICGISTTVWGLVFGGIFGDLIPIKPIVNPLDDVMVLMGMSLLFGILHIYVGLGVKAYNLIRRGAVMDAIFDVILWYVFITGVCLLIIPVVAGPIGIYSTIGKYLAIAGAIGLVLTQGRSQKNIFMKGFKGVSSLYGITGYFADILSYTRLMALCLSTGVIGQVINLLGDIAGPIPAIIIGIVGHTANLLINALGAYVHTSRLQYVEFFGKFYEGGGIPFSPFQYKTKYTRINADNE
ncbi:MAG: V-type ATP synthase subunit I [Epulopiscium sp.]|nr:V-type ATP synthase subunit I [Candidatus Epulonipiscium sp.]